MKGNARERVEWVVNKHPLHSVSEVALEVVCRAKRKADSIIDDV